MRKFIVKHYALDYMSKLWGMNLKFTRSATKIYPIMTLLGILVIIGVEDLKLLASILGALLAVNLFLGFWYFEIRPIKFNELEDIEQKFQFGAGQFSGDLYVSKPKITSYIVPYCILLTAWFGLNLSSNLWVNISAVVLITFSLLGTFIHRTKMDRSSFSVAGMDMEEFNKAQDFVDGLEEVRNYKPHRFIYHPVVITTISVTVTYIVTLLI